MRYYEKIGLILDVTRNPQGHRDYSDHDVAWVDFLKRLKATGMPLNVMKTFAELRYKGDSTVSKRLKILEAHHRNIAEQIETLFKHKQQIAEKIKIYQSWQFNNTSKKS